MKNLKDIYPENWTDSCTFSLILALIIEQLCNESLVCSLIE